MKQFLKFAVVGVMGTIVHYAVLLGLVEVAHLDPVFSSALGAIAGALVNYVLNYHVSFQSTGSHRQLGPKYLVIAFSCFFLNTLFMYLLVDGLSFDYRISQIAVSVVLLIWNFLAARAWVFVVHKYEPDAGNSL